MSAPAPEPEMDEETRPILSDDVEVALMPDVAEVALKPLTRSLTAVVAETMETNKILLEGQCGWTSAAESSRMELAAGAMRTVECALHAGERVRWVIGVASYNILIDARFRERKGGGVNQRILFDRKRLGDEYQQDQSWACGMFTAEAAGTLDLNLDNTTNADGRQVTWGFSTKSYDFLLTRHGQLTMTDPDTQESTQLDLSEITPGMVTKVGDSDLLIELPARRPDEPPRAEGKQLLHFQNKEHRVHCEQNLIRLLAIIADKKKFHGLVLQKWARVGTAKRRLAAKKRDAAIYQGSKNKQAGSAGDVDARWEKPYSELRGKRRPVLVTLRNNTREVLELSAHMYLKTGGAVWQPAPQKIVQRETAAWASHASIKGASNSGCALYQLDCKGKQLDVVVGFCRSGIGSTEWTAGALYRRGQYPQLSAAWQALERQQGEGRTTNTARTDDFVLEWDGGQDGVSAFTLYSDSEFQATVQARHVAEAAEKAAKEVAIARGEQEVVEELIQVQFFNTVFQKYDGAYWRMVPSQNVPATQVPAWSDSKGRKLGSWKSSPEQIHREADKRLLPLEGNWHWSDEPWKVDPGVSEEDGWMYNTGLPYIPGHPCNDMPEVPGTSWSTSKTFTSLVRKRIWKRSRHKRPKRVHKNTDLTNPFFTTTLLPRFVARIATGTKEKPGPVLSIWRPVVAGNKMILGDVLVEGDNPPTKMVGVDLEKVRNSRSEIQREWVQRVCSFNSVWNNGKVFLWRPVVPTISSRFLQRKRLLPLGWIFTTSPAPPDIENVCVIHQDYLEEVSVDDMVALPVYESLGHIFEANTYTNMTRSSHTTNPAIKVTINEDETGLVLRAVELTGGQRRMEIAEIDPGSAVSKCEGLEVGMLLCTIAGQKAITLDASGIQRLLQQRPLRMAFEKRAARSDLLDADGDGKVDLADAGAFAKLGVKKIGSGIGKLGSGIGKLGGKVFDATKRTRSVDDETANEHEDQPCEARFFLERKNGLIYTMLSGQIYADYLPRDGKSFVLKKDMEPEQEDDTLARSSRYTPHLKTLMGAKDRRGKGQAEGDTFICSAMMTKKHSSRTGLHMITGSGQCLRAWDVSKGECTRELDFAGAPVACAASTGNVVFSGSGNELTGTDVTGGRRLPGASFLHVGTVTCVDCEELGWQDSAGREALAVVSGTDKHDRCIRMWISDEGAISSSGDGADSPQTFRRVAVPGIGEHRSGVKDAQIWPSPAPVAHDAFRYFRLIVMRTPRQLREVKVHGDAKDKDVPARKLPTIGFGSFKIWARPDVNKQSSKERPTQVKMASVQNLSFWTPSKLKVEERTFSWTLPASDPDPDGQFSFLRCGAGVVEMCFDSPFVPHSYGWEEYHEDDNETRTEAVEKPEHWELFGSDDWVSWVKLDSCMGKESLADLYGNGCVVREIDMDHHELVLAPFAPPDLQHVPMVVSTGENAVRVWSVCADYETRGANKRRAKGVCLSAMHGHTGDVNCCAVTAGGQIVSGSSDCSVRIWQPHGGRCLAELLTSSPVLCVTTFTLGSSVHIENERISLFKGMQPTLSCSYTIRHIADRAAIPGGLTFISTGEQNSDQPGLGEAGEGTFLGFSWHLEPADIAVSDDDNTLHLYFSCEKDGHTWYLAHKRGKVVLSDREHRGTWAAEFETEQVARPANPRNAAGRGKAGAALLHLHTFYRVKAGKTLAVHDTPSGGQVTSLDPGTLVQIVDAPVRPLEAPNDLWQQVVVVRTRKSSGITRGGWMLAAHETDDDEIQLLLEDVMEHVDDSALVRLRCCDVFDTRPSFLAVGAEKSTAMLTDGLDTSPMCLNLVHEEDAGIFKFEQASAETTVVAGCADGTANIWSNTSAHGGWVKKVTKQPVEHAGAVQQVHLVSTINDDDTEGMLLITCSKEMNDPKDQTIGVWRIEQGLWECVCRLHPVIVPDYIAGLVKYVDPGKNGNFELTYADPTTISLTAKDLLRIRGDYQSLFEKIVKCLRLDYPKNGSIADRSRSREMEPELSFCRERKNDTTFEDGDCYYWIQQAESMNGHGPTYVGDQTLSIEDCEVGMVIRDANTPSDQSGGLYKIVAIDDPNAVDELTFMQKLCNPKKAVQMVADSVADIFADEEEKATITVEKLDDRTGRPDVTQLSEDGRDPGDFLRAAFWEGYSPAPGPDWLLFFCTAMPYDWSVWCKERGIGISRLLLFVLSWPAELWSYRKKLRLGGAQDEDDSWAEDEEDADWNTLLDSAKVGQPVEAMVVPLPGAAGKYSGATAKWANLITFEAKHNHQELSLLHVCVSYCEDHEEEQNSLLALEVPEVVIQYKWYTFGQKKIMEEFRYYLWLVLSFGFVTYRRVEDAYAMGQVWYDHLTMLLTFCLTLSFMWGEMTSVRVGGWADYLPDFWNWLDWSCYILILLVVIWTVEVPDFSATYEAREIVCEDWHLQSAVMYAMPQLLLWSKVLYFLRAFEETGVFTMMIVRIIVKIRFFILIMGIMVMGFAITFYIMFNESDRLRVNVDRRAYETVAMGLLTTYNMGVLGDFNMEAFHEQDRETWLLGLFFLLTAIVQIVLLNLLIALMGSVYEDERENSANHRRAERASMLLEIESKMTEDERSDPIFFPEHLHVLREKLDSNRKHSSGRSVGALPGKSRRSDQRAEQGARPPAEQQKDLAIKLQQMEQSNGAMMGQMLGMLADLKRAGTGTVADGDGRNTIE